MAHLVGITSSVKERLLNRDTVCFAVPQSVLIEIIKNVWISACFEENVNHVERIMMDSEHERCVSISLSPVIDISAIA